MAMKEKTKRQKATQGAMTGAAVGTAVMPGIGTAVGAGVGGLAGYTGLLGDGGDSEESKAQDEMARMQAYWDSIQTPTLQNLDLGEYYYQGDAKPETMATPEALAAQQVDRPQEVAYRAALAQMAQGTPDLQAQRVDSNTAQTSTVGPSAMQGIATDAGLRDAQMRALMQMQEVGESGGMTATERAQVARMQGEVSQADRGRREAILQNARARGMGGSGMELLAQLQSSQSATDRASQEGLDIAGRAQERALQAMAQSGSMAGGLRSQDFGEQSEKARAADIVAQFNAANSQQANMFNAGVMNDSARANAAMAMDAARTNKASAEALSQYNAGQFNDMGQFNAGNQLQTDLANRQAVMAANQYNTTANNNMAQYNQDRGVQVGMYNTTAKNQAAQGNQQARQTLANANVDTANKETTYNTVTKPQAGFDNKVAIAAGKSGAHEKMAEMYSKAADRDAATEQGMMAGGASIAGSLLSSKTSDKRAKKNVRKLDEKDISEFLKSVKPVSFEYRAEIVGDEADGPKVGHLMQDIDDSKIGKLISRDMPSGMKGYDEQGMEGAILAALKMLSDKIDKKVG